MPRSIVIGTAGHIDHGKTTLVRALTGIDADRLPEEKRRGITIDLGFASFETLAPDGSPLRISFVDVPGHSLFIRNMLAGTGCVPAVMLVIAADEGVKPQTEEHLAICNLLGISHGITVITKADAVIASQLQVVTNSIETFLQGTFLAKSQAPILAASALSGEGVETVRAELLSLALRTSPQNSEFLMRLPLDRSFVMKGFGAVVTGTLLSGTIHEGQTLHLEPGNCAVRVRGLQTHGQSQKTSYPGSRVAVNLAGLDAADIHRGQTLVSSKSLSAVDTIDAEVEMLQSAPSLKHRAKVHFHAFTSETMADISLYGYEPMQPGAIRLMRIRLASPILLVPGDRFVLRLPSPAGTVGGGRVLDAHPEPRLPRPLTLAWLELLRTATLAKQIALRVERRNTKGITLAALSAETGLTVDTICRYASPALECGDILRVAGELLLGREAFLAASGRIMSYLRKGTPVKCSELGSQTSFRQEVFDFVLGSLVREQRAQLRDEMVSIYSTHETSLKGENEQIKAIGEAYKAAGLSGPSVLDLARRFKLKEAEMRHLVTLLQSNKTIVRMSNDDLFIHSEALHELTARMADIRGSLIDVARFKQITGLSRKFAIPLLEYLDRQRITRKQGDQRLVL